MSLIAFSNGVLVADTIAEKDLADISFHTTMQKLYVSETKLFAFAYCGNRILARNIPLVHDIIQAMLTMHIVSGCMEPMKFPEAHVNLVDGRSFIIITRDQVFDRLEMNGGFTEYELTDWIAHGTYMGAFAAANAFGLTPVKAVREAVHYCTGRFPELHSVTCDKLKPFKITKEKVKKQLESMQ